MTDRKELKRAFEEACSDYVERITQSTTLPRSYAEAMALDFGCFGEHLADGIRKLETVYPPEEWNRQAFLDAIHDADTEGTQIILAAIALELAQ